MVQSYLMNTHFWVETNVWVEQEVGGTGNFFIGLFEIFILWAFQRCVTRPYLMNTHFWSSLGPRPILWQNRKWVGRFNFFFFFSNFWIWFLWAFQWYLTQLYFQNTHFCSFLCPGPTLGQCRKWSKSFWY